MFHYHFFTILWIQFKDIQSFSIFPNRYRYQYRYINIPINKRYKSNDFTFQQWYSNEDNEWNIWNIQNMTDTNINQTLDNTPTNQTLDNTPTNQNQTNDKIVGIGGQDGLVYDVNKLKRNRIQEAIHNYKEDLLLLLWTLGIDNKVAARTSKTSSTSFEDIQDLSSTEEKYQFMDTKMLGLVQMNPVSTTTDSNLLEGQWTFAYASENAAKVMDASALSNPTTPKKLARLPMSQPSLSSKRMHIVGEPWKMTRNTEGFFRTSTRTVILENLNDSEDPYIIDRTRLLGGLLTFETYYQINHLTRKTLHISPLQYNIHVLSKYKWKKSPQTSYGQIQVLYLDSDLCICRPMGIRKDQSDDNAGPLFLYTKSEVWASGKERTRRKIKLLLTFPFWIKRRIQQKLMKHKESSMEDTSIFDEPKSDTMLIKKNNKYSAISMLKIGEVNAKNEPSWTVDDDPFAHFSLDERVEKMKAMKLEEILKAGELQREKAKKRHDKKYRTPKTIKRPDYL